MAKNILKTKCIDLKILDCPVCLEILRPPVSTCYNGHSVCVTCRKKLRTCPSCRADFSVFKSVVLEKILETVPMSCQNANHGCTVVMPKSDLQKHQNECEYQMMKCLAGHCPNKEMIFANCKSHYGQPYHEPKTIYGQRFGKPYKGVNKYNGGFVLLAYEKGQLFLARVRLTTLGDNKQFCGSVHYIGRAEDAKKYMYILNIEQDAVAFSSKNYCLPYMDARDKIMKHPFSFLVDSINLKVGYKYSITVTESEPHDDLSFLQQPSFSSAGKRKRLKVS